MSTLKVTTVTSPDANTDLILASGNSQSGQILISANGAGVTLKSNSTVNAITINTTSWTFSNNPVFSSNALTIGTAMYVAANGNVGIGTNAPSASLNIRSSGQDAKNLVLGSDTTDNANVAIHFHPRQVFMASPIAKIVGQLGYGLSGQEAGDLVFHTTTSGVSYERMRINSAGNIGIGTNSPSSDYKLDIHTTTGPYNTRFYNSNTSNTSYNAIVIGQGATGSAAGYIGTGGANTTNPSFRNTFVVGTQSQNDLVLNTYDTERVRISSNGNIGIAVSPSAFKVDIAGSMRCLYSSEGIQTTGDTIGRDFLAGKSSVATCIGYVGNSAMVQGTTFTLGATPDLSIQPYGGNTGIGTTTPTMKLDVNGRIKTTGVYFGSDTSSAPNDLTKHVLLWSTNSSALNGYGFGITGNQLNYVSDQNHVWYNTDKEYMRITTDGQVGIGTPSPNINTNGRVLHIHNPSTDVQANSGVGIHITNGTTGATAARGILIARWNDGVNYFGTYEAESIRFGTNGFTTRLEIDSAGRVMIPYQPYMFAYSTGGDIAGAGVKLTSYTNVYRNVGNHYNSTNQRFTVPVTGNYYVMLQAWQAPGVAISGVALRVNGTEFTVHRMSSTGTQSDYTTLRATGVYYLTAGDYIEPYTHNTNVNLHLSTGTTFSQFLVYLLS